MILRTNPTVKRKAMVVPSLLNYLIEYTKTVSNFQNCALKFNFEV